jgi:hypothetical protein
VPLSGPGCRSSSGISIRDDAVRHRKHSTSSRFRPPAARSASLMILRPNIMIAFEIHLNGKKAVTAGIDGPGVLSAIVNWVERELPPKERRCKDDMSVSVGGLAARTNTFLTWLQRDISVGDEIFLRVVETDKVDKARKQRREKAAVRRRRQKAYVRSMAKKWGWKIQT